MESLLPFYIITGIISIVIAILLAHFARLSSQSGPKAEKTGAQKDYIDSGIKLDTEIQHSVFAGINDIVDSKERCQEISKVVSGIFNEELNKRISQTSQELSRKYEGVIKEKAQNEEIAWRKYKQVSSDKKNTEAVIRSIAEGLVVVDAKGKVIMMNPAAEKLLGSSKKERIGKPIADNLKDEQLISLVKNSPESENKEIELVSKTDETKKVLKASSAVIEDENGRTIGMVSVLSDITKQKELDRLKANFVANVSHELRTPLVSIDKSIALILTNAAGKVSDTQREFLTIAQRNIKRLSILINDLLDLSKLEAGKMEIQRQPSSIGEIIEESVLGLGTWANSKSIKLEKNIQEGLPQVNVDPNKIIQVLNNLIGNAIKFTPNDGTITVKAVLAEEKKEISVSVQDSGIGISKEALPKVFDKFYQVGERVSTDIHGTGIGLSITREIVELHGGKIWVESEKGCGAAFIFTIPFQAEGKGEEE